MPADEYDPPKTSWGPGSWQHEPDRHEWRYKGLPCLARRGPIGAWCGYVAVPPGHPWHGKNYDAVGAYVHGGLTYANSCEGNPDICHVPQPGESDHVWWLGFDCGHAGDLIPGFLGLRNTARSTLRSFTGALGETYKDLAYVKQEVEHLADQVLEAGH